MEYYMLLKRNHETNVLFQLYLNFKTLKRRKQSFYILIWNEILYIGNEKRQCTVIYVILFTPV